MLEQVLLRPHPEPRFSHEVAKRAVSAPHASRQNHILAALPRHDFERLLPDLELVSLPPGCTVHGAGDRDSFLYFIASGIVARFYVTASGASTGVAVTGSEGVIGIASLLGGESMPTQAVVLIAGCAYRLRAQVLQGEIGRGGALLRLLLRYTETLIEQVGHRAVCNRHHSVEQQLCRWILSCVDRLPTNELALTQEVIAEMLGVRREGVSAAAGALQRAGLIRCSRGRISLLDRPRLEARVCECYSAVKRENERLLPESAQARFAS